MSTSFSDNARVNQNAASESGPQVEPSIASNSRNRAEMVSGFSDWTGSAYAPGVAWTTTAGKTWSAPATGADVPNPPGLVWGDQRIAGHIGAADSATAWSTGETAYFATLGGTDVRNPPGGNCAVGGIFVYRSVDGGNTWTLPAGGPAAAMTQTSFTDRDYIAADSSPTSLYGGNVYVAWDEYDYSSCPFNFPDNFVAL